MRCKKVEKSKELQLRLPSKWIFESRPLTSESVKNRRKKGDLGVLTKSVHRIAHCPTIPPSHAPNFSSAKSTRANPAQKSLVIFRAKKRPTLSESHEKRQETEGT